MNGRERLAVLADALEANAANPTGMKFDLGVWLDPGDTLPTMNCGTVGCAVGLAMLLPALQAEGLGGQLSVWNGKPAPKFESNFGWDAVTRFFDLGYIPSTHLFDAAEYKDGPTHGAEAELRVAKRIREYLSRTKRMPGLGEFNT